MSDRPTNATATVPAYLGYRADALGTTTVALHVTVRLAVPDGLRYSTRPHEHLSASTTLYFDPPRSPFSELAQSIREALQHLCTEPDDDTLQAITAAVIGAHYDPARYHGD